MVSRPFSTINRDINLSPESVFIVRVETWSDRDTHQEELVFTNVEAAIQRAKDSFHQDASDEFHYMWDYGSQSKPEPEYFDYVSINDQTRRLLGKPAKSRNRSIYYIGWNFPSIEEDDIISDDSLSELSWDSEYGLKTGRRVVQLMWNPEMGRYG